VLRRDDLDERGVVVDRELLSRAPADPGDQIDPAVVNKIVDAETVTVEVFARWVHDRLPAACGELPSAAPAVRVQESPVAAGGSTASP
jgi:6-pyruvoyltetrahydropterin/6-carboxytetrahydropterin synthase